MGTLCSAERIGVPPKLTKWDENNRTALNEYLDDLWYVSRGTVSHYADMGDTLAVTSATTLKLTDRIILCTGTFTITLPKASLAHNKIYHIKNVDTGTITIDGNGSDTIDGQTTQVLPIQYQSLSIVSDGTEWLIF